MKLSLLVAVNSYTLAIILFHLPHQTLGEEMLGSLALKDVISRQGLGRWDPRNLMKNIFHPMTLPRIYGHLLEQADQSLRAHVAEDSIIGHRDS